MFTYFYIRGALRGVSLQAGWFSGYPTETLCPVPAPAGLTALVGVRSLFSQPVSQSASQQSVSLLPPSYTVRYFGVFCFCVCVCFLMETEPKKHDAVYRKEWNITDIQRFFTQFLAVCYKCVSGRR